MPWSGDVFEETLVPSAARTTSGSLESGDDWGEIDRVRAQLEGTAAFGTTPHLTVSVESTADGTNWPVLPGGPFAAKTAAGREVINLTSPVIARRVRVRW